MKMFKVSAPLVVAALLTGATAAAQSQDKDKPTPLTGREITGVFDASDRRELDDSYSAGPGELVIALDVDGGPKRLANATAKVDIYDTDFNRLAGFYAQSGFNGESERKVGRYTLDQRVQTVMRITFEYGPGSYKLRLSGTAMDAAASPGKSTSSGPATGTAASSGKSTSGGPPTDAAPISGTTPNSGKSTTGAGGLQLPKQGMLTVKMKDGSTHTINLADVATAEVR